MTKKKCVRLEGEWFGGAALVEDEETGKAAQENQPLPFLGFFRLWVILKF